MLKQLGLLFVIFFFVADTPQFKPMIHFSPQQHWINDPNGLVYYDGEYHLFFQHNPYGSQWGNMSWGHAVSTDLINWSELDIAIPYTDGVMAFSGSAVIDWNNTSGFGNGITPPMVAIYTGYTPTSRIQDQRIAYSLDRGRTFTKYSQNPVIDLQSTEFRDPKVFWHHDTSKWIMVVALATERKIRFYTSPDLKNWSFSQDFGPFGEISGVWECPDLFEFDLMDTVEPKWVLVVSYAPGKAQYFVGRFDGAHFTLEEEKIKVDEILIDNFETDNYGSWTQTGSAFGTGPATGTLPNQQLVSGYLGNRLINTFLQGDVTTGTLQSPEFVIEKNYLNFLIGGGNHSNTTYVSLIIDNNEVFRASGDNTEQLKSVSWDLSAYKDKIGKILIVDNATGGWGHILADQFVQSDTPKPTTKTKFVDYGNDFYAAQSFSDVSNTDGRRLWLAWMANWNYAGNLPTSPWRGSMNIPRQLTLIHDEDNYILRQQPVEEITSKRETQIVRSNTNLLSLNSAFGSANHEVYDLILDLNIAQTHSFEIIFNENNTEFSKLSFEKVNFQFEFDRSQSGFLTENNSFSEKQVLTIPPSEQISIRIVADRGSIEIFIEDGDYVFSNITFPSNYGLRFEDTSGTTQVNQASFFQLNPTLSKSSQQESQKVLVYPTLIGNSQDSLKIIAHEAIKHVCVFDVNGKILWRRVPNNNLHSLTIPVLFSVNGIYFVETTTSSGKSVSKVIRAMP